MILAICYVVGIVAGLLTLCVFHKATPPGQSLGCGAFLTAFAVFFITSILTGSAFDSVTSSSPPASASSEVALREMGSHSQARLSILRSAKDEGRLIERVAASVSENRDTLQILVHNRSDFQLTVVKVEVVNAAAWEKYLNERYNGILVKDMPRKMRSDWLRTTGYWTTYNRIRGETHRQIIVSAHVPPHAEVVHSEPLPAGFSGSAALKARIFEVSDVSGKSWSSLAEIEQLEFMSRL